MSSREFPRLVDLLDWLADFAQDPASEGFGADAVLARLLRRLEKLTELPYADLREACDRMARGEPLDGSEPRGYAAALGIRDRDLRHVRTELAKVRNNEAHDLWDWVCGCLPIMARVWEEGRRRASTDCQAGGHPSQEGQPASEPAPRVEVMRAAASDDRRKPEPTFDSLTASPTREVDKTEAAALIAEHLVRRVVKAIRDGELPGAGWGRNKPQPPPDLTIYGEGQRSYRVGSSRPVCVTEEEDSILQAFSGYPTMGTPELTAKSKLKHADPSRVLRGLRQKYDGLFAAAIRCPGKKGRGGYHAVVKFLDTTS
jgi:hypothetical protein